ncbi:hypothetical protein [Kalamiella sp. sgz302252]|uniref:hypothetical protein n=1 Tax=Pantoea sp. sgz302252 TaxID=3341827 RepID=UPI0036D429DC
MQMDLTTLLAERDAQKHKAELEKLREENQRLLQQVSDRIDLAKAEITESAINKTMSVLDNTRKWVLGIIVVFASVLTLAGVIGISGMSSKMTEIVTDKVNSWLRFDDGNSGSHQIMDELRTNALLDSLTLRYARDNARGGGNQPHLNTAEKQRLMAIILNPSSDNFQFRDALSLLIASRGIFGLVYEDDTGKKIAGVLSRNDFNNEKKVAVLELMKKERALYPFSLQMLNDRSKGYDENILMDAFANVRQFDENRARQFAQANLNTFKSAHNRVELAKFLIDIGADGADIDALMTELYRQQQLQQQKSFVWDGYYQALIFARIEHGLAAASPDIPALTQLIATQMDKGLQLTISNFGIGKPWLYFSLEKSSDALSLPEKLFGNAALVDAIVKAQPLTADRLRKVSDFFQTTDRGAWITTLMMTPAAATRLTLTDGRKALGDEILDSVWLRVEEKAGQPTLIASWRDKTGKVREGIVADIANGQQARFHVDFDSWQLDTWRWKPDLTNPLY